jgi:hypothetical protein
MSTRMKLMARSRSRGIGRASPLRLSRERIQIGKIVADGPPNFDEWWSGPTTSGFSQVASRNVKIHRSFRLCEPSTERRVIDTAPLPVAGRSHRGLAWLLISGVGGFKGLADLVERMGVSTVRPMWSVGC